jgi:hypothetical protein
MGDEKSVALFPKTLNRDLWESYLDRQLTTEEIFIINDVKMEKMFNDKMEKLYENAKPLDLYIPVLTNLHGNCLFESLEYYKLCDDHDEFRKSLANLMYMVKDCKSFMPNQDRSLKDMFSDTNEIEMVFCRNDEHVYKYTYDVMCQDFSSEFSWTRLPTQLIMMVISYVFDVELVILSNSSTYIHRINQSTKPNPTQIYLGHIGESHYVPLDKKRGHPDEEKCLKYNNSKVRFYKWAFFMQEVVLGVSAESKAKEADQKQEQSNVSQFTEVNVQQEQQTNLVSF